MGEAKRKSKSLGEFERHSLTINSARFNIFAIGARHYMARVLATELSYWSDPTEKILGMVFRDNTDGDHCWMIFGRDRIGRFRSIFTNCGMSNEMTATKNLRIKMSKLIVEDEIEKHCFQGDEPNAPFDLLDVSPSTDPSNLHPFFKVLKDNSGRLPARAIIKEIGPWLAPTDPHFVKEFQQKQFDQRLWELYLWASFRELGFNVEQPEAPDFLCTALGIEFTVEATTAAPSLDGPLKDHPNPQTPEEMQDFLAHYMPMKFGSGLTSKLNKEDKKEKKRYWERGKAPNKPFILAVADFHKPGGEGEIGSMTYSHSALWPYLYGHRVEWEMVDGNLVVHTVKGDQHKYGTKIVPTGFFDLEGAENISAVLFSNAGTLAKFDRMGIVAGFSNPMHKYYRMGYMFDPDPNAIIGKTFVIDVESENYSENWSDELQLFHNPNAKRPIPTETFAGITQHYFKDGDHYSIAPEGSILASRTMILHLTTGDREKLVV